MNTPGFNVQLRKSGFSYDVYSVSNEAPHQESPMVPWHQASDAYFPGSLSLRGEGMEARPLEFHRIDFDLIDSNPNCEIITPEPYSDYLNYYTTGTPVEGATFVRSYQSVKYKDIYPGIDLEFLVDGELRFKYNFVIYPGGRVEDIQLQITDPEIELTQNGSILLKTSMGTIEEEIPHSYLQVNDFKNEINVKFREISENIYGFRFKGITDHNSTLIIDPYPTRIWGTYYGGHDQDAAWGCSVDCFGDVLISGSTSSLSFIATAGAHQSTIGSTYASDTFLAKFSPSGQRIWGTYYGGTSNDKYGWSCPTDNAGNIYLGGETSSTTNIATPGAHQPTNGGEGDAFLVKFNPNGQRIWGTYYGGSSQDYALSCSTDDSCNVYLGGSTQSLTNISTPGAHQANLGGGLIDGFIVKFDSSGLRLWGTYYGGSNLDNIQSISTDTNGHVLSAGNTRSTNNIASPTAFQNTIGGENDAYLTLFTEGGERIWGTYYGGDTTDHSLICIITDQEHIYLLGSTTSANNISTAGSHQPIKSNGSDAFLVKFGINGIREWGTYYGGDSIDEAWRGLAVNDSGYIYISGNTASLNNMATPGSYLTTYQGGYQDAFIGKFNEGGKRIWGTYVGGPAREHSGSIALDSCGILYFSGASQSDTNIATTGAHQTHYNGGINWGDGFLMRFSDCELPDTAQAITGLENVCEYANGIIYSV
ncbi:MAG: hypothetical protein HQ542_10820 [Bacteroidia bacterium]|nr:hypothetical protein [Bacteroidia bacterium]